MQTMILNDRLTIQRMLGQIEGAACGIDNNGIVNLILEAVITIDEKIDAWWREENNE